MKHRHILIQNSSHPEVTPVNAFYCDTFWCQLRGLTFNRFLPFDQGLLLVQKRANRLDSAIHMLGMLIDLAVVWIDDDLQVVDVRLARRWRPAYVSQKPARYVLEMAVGRLNDFQIGDRLKFEEA